jgi:hypothetical protein
MDFVAVDLIQHFVSSTGVEIVGDAVDARFVIALYQDLDSCELLAHGIFAARKQVDGQNFSPRPMHRFWRLRNLDHAAHGAAATHRAQATRNPSELVNRNSAEGIIAA